MAENEISVLDTNGQFTESERIIVKSIEDEMERCYGDYSMSVIVSRALPDARDGLKPVQRRILFAMMQLGLTPNTPHRKSARIVGDTMGKYHPHGDSSIYEALVRMAQDFTLRYSLIDGHGNFGSIDGDGAAAMRYTEARFKKLAMEMLADINKDTVDFVSNFDETEKEPVVLPSYFPNLLVNGTDGIAVGMATNMQPHNLTDVVAALCKIIDNKIAGVATTIEELIDIVKAPDYPTGGIILGTKGVLDAYRTGKGKLILRAKAEIETDAKGKSRIIVTEIPYKVNKAKLIEQIAGLVRDKKVEGITDLRDESNKEGIRIVIELRKDVNANILLNQLYKNTQMQDSIGIINLALVNKEPKVLNLQELMEIYLEHAIDVLTRKSKFELKKAEERLHIIEGLLIALDHLDAVITTIRASKDATEARNSLMQQFALTDVQASAIVEMRLRALTGLERTKLQSEYDELQKTISHLKGILSDEKVLLGTIRENLVVIDEKYGDARRTQIATEVEAFVSEDLIADEQCVVTMTSIGYIKRLPVTTYKSQKRGGKGVVGMQTREADIVKDLLVCKTHDNLLFFTSKGKVYSKKVYEIPEAGRNAKGTAIVNLLSLDGDEQVKAIIPIRDLSESNTASFVMLTKKGIIKKTLVNEYKNIRQRGLIAINIQDGDELVQVEQVTDDATLFVATNKGLGCRFKASDIRNIGRSATGVRGIKTEADNYVIGFVVCPSEDTKIVFVSDKGFGKATKASEFIVKNRGIKGVLSYNVSVKTGQLAKVMTCAEDDELLLVNTSGVVIRLKADVVPVLSRNTLGVKLVTIGETERITSISKVIKEDAIEE